MALPTKVKTWTIDPTNRETCATLLEAIGNVMLGIKNALKLMSGVTVKGSSNGVAGAMDGTDRWVTSANVQTRNNGPAGAQSWIVLDLANMGGAELLMTYNASGQQGFAFYYSPGGNYIVAATATHKPTATDEVTISGGNSIMTPWGTADRLWNVGFSTDGSALWFFIAESNAITCCVFMQIITTRLAAGITFSPAIAAFAIGTQVGHTGKFDVWGIARPACRLDPGSGAINISGKFGTEGYGTQLAPVAQANVCELQGGFQNIYPVSFWSDTALARGAIGTFIDLWCGNSGANDGDTYPNDATRQFIQVSDFLLPWDGSIPTLI